MQEVYFLPISIVVFYCVLQIAHTRLSFDYLSSINFFLPITDIEIMRLYLRSMYYSSPPESTNSATVISMFTKMALFRKALIVTEFHIEFFIN